LNFARYFSDEGTGTAENPEVLETIASLLGVTTDFMSKFLTSTSAPSGGPEKLDELCTQFPNLCDRCQAFAIGLYDNLWKSVLLVINK
jgi:hypothetical protein